MSINENSIESNWNITPLKKENESEAEKGKPIVKAKENRNFCEKWLSLFSPWLSRCEDDPNRPYCRACQRPCDNNRFRLQRHERTAKHARNQEILLNEGEDAVRLLLHNTKRRYIKKETPMKSFLLDTERINFKSEIPFKKFKTQQALRAPVDKNESGSNFKYPKQEYLDMSDYYYSSQHRLQRPPPPPQPKKDTFDMFFEAISATVKNLPPKLAAEVKSRVSQVIAEFELRAICEKEAREKALQQSVVTMPPQVTNVVTIDPVIVADSNNANTSAANQQNPQCTPTVTQYVYSYQQKKEIN